MAIEKYFELFVGAWRDHKIKQDTQKSLKKGTK